MTSAGSKDSRSAQTLPTDSGLCSEFLLDGILTSLAQGPATGYPWRGDIGAVDLGVAVGAAVDKELPDAGYAVDRVGIMALETEKRHGCV